jgi:protein TonB
MATDRPPTYPALALRRHDEGQVLLEVSVSPEGQPTAVTLRHSSTHDALDQAAIEAVRQWRFVPAMRNSVAVAATAEVPVDFRMPR